jgi:hypothetical protein
MSDFRPVDTAARPGYLGEVEHKDTYYVRSKNENPLMLEPQYKHSGDIGITVSDEPSRSHGGDFIHEVQIQVDPKKVWHYDADNAKYVKHRSYPNYEALKADGYQAIQRGKRINHVLDPSILRPVATRNLAEPMEPPQWYIPPEARGKEVLYPEDLRLRTIDTERRSRLKSGSGKPMRRINLLDPNEPPTPGTRINLLEGGRR